ncbi:OPT superfamily oligopeptide transporter [Atractiella rhizophila]|nr:OPT superfamily oligopeptide transporter [Atractiella rhizophila]
MAETIQSQPKKPERTFSVQSDGMDEKFDEKASLKDELGSGIGSGIVSVKQDIAALGDVWEDVREIDLDSTGKERAVETSEDWGYRLVSLADDPSAPVWTFRMWFIAIGLSCFGAVLSQIFAFRPQTVYVSQLFLQTFSYIMGRGLEYLLPGPEGKLFQTNDTAFFRWLNPGKFNIKEHVATLIMAAAATHGALAINIFAADDLFYHFKPNVAIAIFTLLGSQLIGYGLAGIYRSFLVYPTHQVFPNLMPTIQMFDVLHRGADSILQKKRLKFFWSLFCIALVWEWFPEYIAPTLTGISIFCLARQNSPWVTRIFGGAAGNEGLGLFAICLDWQYVGSGGSAYGALFQPIQTQLSLYVGVLICIISFCAVYANNVWKAQNFPFLSQLLFLENGSVFDQTTILTDKFELDEAKLAEVGLPWFSATQTVTAIGNSLSFGATVTHLILWYWKDIKDAVIKSRRGTIEDAHYEKMKVYKEVPYLWYVGLFVASLAIAFATCYTGHSQLPWWGLIVSVLFAAIFLPIISTLYGVLCFVPGTQDVAQMIAAAILPGKPIANMYFSLYAYNSTEQGRSMTRDLKMGQYTKLPPRVTFTMQNLGAVIGALLNYVIMRTVVDSHREILLSVQGTNTWSGAGVQSFNSNAVSWGALAKHLYAPSSRYGIIPLSIFIGLALPVPFWLIHQKFPHLRANTVITPMVAASIGYLSGGINSSIFTTFLLCLVSQFWLRKYHPRWFRKYNFLVSAALDGGTEVMIFIYSFAVGGAGGKVTSFPQWALNPAGNPDYCMRLTS